VKRQRSKSPEPERLIQQRIIEALQWHGYVVIETPVLHGTLIGEDGRRWHVHLGELGRPDLLAVPREHALWIEVKRPGEKPEPHQKQWHLEAAARGERVIVARSHEEVLEAI
jgi:hypothetical protein